MSDAKKVSAKFLRLLRCVWTSWPPNDKEKKNSMGVVEKGSIMWEAKKR